MFIAHLSMNDNRRDHGVLHVFLRMDHTSMDTSGVLHLLLLLPLLLLLNSVMVVNDLTDQ